MPCYMNVKRYSATFATFHPKTAFTYAENNHRGRLRPGREPGSSNPPWVGGMRYTGMAAMQVHPDATMSTGSMARAAGTPALGVRYGLSASWMTSTRQRSVREGLPPVLDFRRRLRLRVVLEYAQMQPEVV